MMGSSAELKIAAALHERGDVAYVLRAQRAARGLHGRAVGALVRIAVDDELPGDVSRMLPGNARRGLCPLPVRAVAGGARGRGAAGDAVGVDFPARVDGRHSGGGQACRHG